MQDEKTLTRAEWEKIRKDNTRRAKGMRGKREKKEKSRKAEAKKEEGTQNMRRGMWALKEIKKYQSSTELLI